jgi:hypothetical protein
MRDGANAAGEDAHYRLNIGAFPLVTRAFPLGLRSGTETAIQVEGFNLGGKQTVRLQTAAEPAWGKTMEFPVASLSRQRQERGAGRVRACSNSPSAETRRGCRRRRRRSASPFP